MDLATAYVQIVPTTKGIKGSLSEQLGGEASSAGTSAGASFGSSMVSKLKGIIAAAGIGALFKKTLEAGADLEQSFGGLDTIYGEAADAAKKYAKEAAKAGISANDYAEQAVTMGAALKMALGNDATAAAEKANVAIMDMADNAARMGTSIESLQNAYTGFSRGNFTMLDNLSLGFAGTKEGMQQLLDKAEEISGIKYDISSYADIVDAIHVVQGEMKLTGVAADEAATTFSGSLNAMKAAAQNVMAAIATGGNIGEALKPLLESTRNFLVNNLIPMVGNVLSALPDVLTEALIFAFDLLQDFTSNAQEIVDFGINLITKLVEVLITNAPMMIEGALGLIQALAQAFIEHDWMETLTTMMTNIKSGLATASADFGTGDSNVLTSFFDKLMAELPKFIETGVEVIKNLINGLLQALPDVIETAGNTIITFVDGILNNLPTIMEAGIELLMSLVEGIVNNLPAIVSAVVDIIGKFLETLLTHLPEIIESGITLIGKLVSGLIEAIPKIIAAMPKIIAAIIDAIIHTDWIGIGKDIIMGLVNGIKNAASAVWEAIKSVCGQALQAAKDFLGIASPSKVMRDKVGQWIPAGIAEGIEANTDSVDDAMTRLSESMTDEVNGNIQANISTGSTLSAMNFNSGINNGYDNLRLGESIKSALEGMGLYMDSRQVGYATAGAVNNSMGRFNARRT